MFWGSGWDWAQKESPTYERPSPRRRDLRDNPEKVVGSVAFFLRLRYNGSMKQAKKRTYLLLLAALLVLAFVLVSYRGLEVNTYTVVTDKIRGTVRIAVLSDLHSVTYGENQSQLSNLLAAQNPDLVLLAGDIVDDERAQDGAKQLFAQIGRKYPCFYVTGNHEFWSDQVDSIKTMVASYGIRVLDGDTHVVTVRGNRISVGGVDDYATGRDWQWQIDRCNRFRDRYSILLSHRPDLVETYETLSFDLIVSGHAHGGQARLPVGNFGLIAPNQGLFPRYTSGIYALSNGTQLAVSRGLAKDLLPRPFNPPELMMIELVGKEG